MGRGSYWLPKIVSGESVGGWVSRMAVMMLPMGMGMLARAVSRLVVMVLQGEQPNGLHRRLVNCGFYSMTPTFFMAGGVGGTRESISIYTAPLHVWTWHPRVRFVHLWVSQLLAASQQISTESLGVEWGCVQCKFPVV